MALRKTQRRSNRRVIGTSGGTTPSNVTCKRGAPLPVPGQSVFIDLDKTGHRAYMVLRQGREYTYLLNNEELMHDSGPGETKIRNEEFARIWCSRHWPWSPWEPTHLLKYLKQAKRISGTKRIDEAIKVAKERMRHVK